MTTSLLTVLAAVLYLIIRFRMKEKVEWTDFITTVLAMHTLLSITDIMTRYFMGVPITEQELMKPVTIGFIVILFGAYQNLLKNLNLN